MKKATGFTLVELVITVLIASVLIAWAVPSMDRMISDYRLTTITNEFISSLHIARQEAIKRNRSVSLCRNAASGSGESEDGENEDGASGAEECPSGSDTWQRWLIIDSSDTVIRKEDNPGDRLQITSTFTNDTILFSPAGVPVGEGSVIICSLGNAQERHREISIGPGNRLTTTRSDNDCP